MSRQVLYNQTNIPAYFVGIMPRSRRSFNPPALYPLFDENVDTKSAGEDDVEAANYRRLVVAEVGVRPHVWLDEIEELHEPTASLVNRHLCMVEGKLWMRALIKTPNLVLVPHTQKRFFGALPYH